MRTIENRPEPAELTEWRARAQSDLNFGYPLMPGDVRRAVKEALVAQQRELCAYTGIRVETNNSHIEHLLPQVHCQRGEDVAYSNMVACFPGSNSEYVAFGALRKRDWPSRENQHLFVSPRSAACEARFAFNIRGEIFASRNDDMATDETIRQLGLDDVGLTARRRAAIGATLNMPPQKPALLDLKSARHRLAKLLRDEAGAGRLEPFCFVLKQALVNHIRRVESIRQSKAEKH